MNARIVRGGCRFPRRASHAVDPDRRASYDRSRLSSESSFLFDGIRPSAREANRKAEVEPGREEESARRAKGSEKARRGRREERGEGRGARQSEREGEQ